MFRDVELTLYDPAAERRACYVDERRVQRERNYDLNRRHGSECRKLADDKRARKNLKRLRK